jgi:parallel beta-helix repeat protein
MKSGNTITAVTIATLAATAGLLVAGPLNPPGGPVTGTYKTLTEVEPRIAINLANTPGDADSLFKITQPGSYYLTGNISGVVGKHGIEIAANNVTIDLSGFDLVGVTGMGAFDGVSLTAFSAQNIVVRNGSVRGWGDAGVDLANSYGLNCRIESVLASRNIGHGITVGLSAAVTACSSFDNGGDGIRTDSVCVVADCLAYSNSGAGIDVGDGGTALRCTASFNDSTGISVGSGSTVADCVARFNTGSGITVSSQSVVRGNTSTSNGNLGGDGGGIHVLGTDNRIEGNQCTGSDRGIDVDTAGNFIIRNTCSGNAVNWTIVANNVVGPILDRTAPASAAINGNSAPDSTGSTHPNANFTY